jgi:hypothetical protein
LANALQEPPSLGSLSPSLTGDYSSGLPVDILAPSQALPTPDRPPGNRQSGGTTDPPHGQYSLTPSIHPSTTSYPFSAFLMTPARGPTLGSLVSSISSVTSIYSASSSQDVAIASPIVRNEGVAVAQGPQSSRRHVCRICAARFGQKQALNPSEKWIELNLTRLIKIE